MPGLIPNGYWKLATAMEKRLPLWTLCAFALGVIFPLPMRGVVTRFLAAYVYLGPVAIFFILAPSLARIIHSSKNRDHTFTGFAILWLCLWRLGALLFAVVFTGLVFGLPLTGGENSGFLPVVLTTAKSLGRMMTHSTYFFAMYLALAIVFLSTKRQGIARWLEACAAKTEIFGQAMIPFFPLFMMAIGGFVAELPQAMQGPLGPGITYTRLHALRFLGITIQPSGPLGMFAVYLAASLLTAMACMIWHGLLLAWCKAMIRNFSLALYFRDYWLRIYPSLWATASESLSAPLNLYLVKEHYPQIRTEVRRFVVGVGTYLDINGTMICVILLTVVVSGVLGIALSWAQLALCVPLVFLIGFGVPGIPGELLLFGWPLALLLHLPPRDADAFLALFLGLQLGLPDSFRTGNNSTDSCPLALLLNEIYVAKYTGREDE